MILDKTASLQWDLDAAKQKIDNLLAHPSPWPPGHREKLQTAYESERLILAAIGRLS